VKLKANTLIIVIAANILEHNSIHDHMHKKHANEVSCLKLCDIKLCDITLIHVYWFNLIIHKERHRAFKCYELIAT
jgi:hypothetical protein